MSDRPLRAARWGAVFLMATSAIGPGFLTQTTMFTQQLRAAFIWALIVSVLIDIGAQLLIWRVLSVSGLRAPAFANRWRYGVGHGLVIVLLIGGWAFNIANLGGCGLGWSALTGWSPAAGAGLSTLLVLLLFNSKGFIHALDRILPGLAFVMVALVGYIAFTAAPPIGEVAEALLQPRLLDVKATLTLVGGTVGGYISFAGAHRLLEAGYTGAAHVGHVSGSAVRGILVTAFMRMVLFLAVLGVVSGGASLAAGNPVADVFGAAAGVTGQRFFGLVMWCASISSVVGCTYTTVSFVESVAPRVEKYRKGVLLTFVITSALVLAWLGQPATLLVIAGFLNGWLLPLALLVMLLAIQQQGGYRHPVWLRLAGWVACLATGALAAYSVLG